MCTHEGYTYEFRIDDEVTGTYCGQCGDRISTRPNEKDAEASQS